LDGIMAQAETQGGSKATSITETTFEDPKKEEVEITEATEQVNMDSQPTALKEQTTATEKEAQANLDAEEDIVGTAARISLRQRPFSLPLAGSILSSM
jgi:hypothetical protein